MSTVITERLVDIARAVEAAGWGERGKVAAAAAAELGISPATLARRLAEVRVAAPRKRRTDAGTTALAREEALLIAATVEETRRLTGTGCMPLADVVDTLRANGRILAGRVDVDTGEFFPLSLSAIRRALRGYGLHPEQLAEPTPAAALSSPHPNWCWQIDASVSRQFYLGDAGTEIMARGEYYRGKPQNFARISSRRLWRYAVTDHASGYIELLYVLGAESAANLLATLIHVMTPRAGAAMHGLPRYLMGDPGSAVRASTTRHFCACLDIELIVNKAGNARAKGQVENANYLIETHFEAPLKLRAPVVSLEEMNALAAEWSRVFNATRIHSRTRLTRRDGWLRITPEQLRLAPAVEVLRALPVSTPKPCQVRDQRIRFDGATYDVSGISGLINGAAVEVMRNPFDGDNSVRVLLTGEDGQPTHYVAPRVPEDAWGFLVTAAEVGTAFRAPRETPVDANRKAIERLAMEVATDAEAAAARKRRRVPFKGAIDPLKTTREAYVPTHLPRAGQPAVVEAPTVVHAAPRTEPVPIRHELPPLSHFAAAARLKPLVEAAGTVWCAEHYQRTAERWPQGLPVEALETWAAELARPAPVTLRVVGA